MKNLLAFVFVLAAAVGFAGEKTIDWVALNGGSPEKIFGSGFQYETYENGVAYYSDGRLKSELTVESGRFKLKIVSPFNAGNNGWCFAFTNETGLTFGEAQKIVVPYKYDMSGTAAVGMRFRLIVGTTTGNKYFGLLSEETIVKGEEAFLTFNLSDVYIAYPTVYEAVKDSPITIMRLYPFEGGSGYTTSATVISGGASKFAKDDLLYIGAFAVTWEDITGYTVSFDANGGNSVEDISTDMTGEFTFPSTTREGWNFLGWYRDGSRYAVGDAGKVVMDSEYVAGWRHSDLTQGLVQMPTYYRKDIDLFKAYGSCCEAFTGDSVKYYPLIDRLSSIRVNVYQVDVEPLACGTVTNIALIGKSGNAGNNSPEVVLPVVGVALKDIHDVKVCYRTTSTALEGIAMTLRYQLGSTWYTVTSEDKMQCSTGDEFHTVKFKVAAALGETNYEKNKDKTIAAWRLRPYVGSALPFRSGVSMELGRIQLIGEHPMGMKVIVR